MESYFKKLLTHEHPTSSFLLEMDQQAGGTDDPSKPSKKKPNDEDSRNKKLVRTHCTIFVIYSLSSLILFL